MLDLQNKALIVGALRLLQEMIEQDPDIIKQEYHDSWETLTQLGEFQLPCSAQIDLCVEKVKQYV